MTASDQRLLRRLGRKIHSKDLRRGWQRAVARALGVGDTKISDVLSGMTALSDAQRKDARAWLGS